MKMSACFALSFALLACNVNSWDPPLKPTTDYPCNPTGVVCVTQHGCCAREEVCGGEPDSVGCPAGMCCANGLFATADGGMRMHPQTTQK